MQKSPVGDVIGGRQTIVKEYPVLPSSLPNKIIVTGSRYDKLPSQLQQKITWAFSKDLLGDLVDPVSFPFAKVNNQKISGGANGGRNMVSACFDYRSACNNPIICSIRLNGRLCWNCCIINC